MKVYDNVYNLIISPENLFRAWKRFRADKGQKKDVRRFEWRLEQNIFTLHHELASKTYKHGPYTSFFITDPKQRHIHKAAVRDRMLHHAIVQVITPFFEQSFIYHSFSCRIGKGTHKGFAAVETMTRRVSENYTKPCFALKCDIEKFFDSVDHFVLLETLRRRIKDRDVMWLLTEIVESFSSSRSTLFERKGLPIGNLTSQLFANVYLNDFDQFMKHELKVRYYARYTDDFVALSQDKQYLVDLLPRIRHFLKEQLDLSLHPEKVTICTLHQGVDFLGYVARPHHRLLRTKTKRRVFKGLQRRAREYRAGIVERTTVEQSFQSYLGALSHANTYKTQEKLKNLLWFWLSEN